MPVQAAILYKRATFVTRLPVTHRYASSHYWLTRQGANRWRVGFTRFALRMLGELVEVTFDPPPGAAVGLGDVLGNIEGFKAISDIYSLGSGRFGGGNPRLNESLNLIVEAPYDAGWLYEFEGDPEPRTLDVAGYRVLLDETIDRLLAQPMTGTDTP